MLRFRRMRSLQMFATVHASVTNHFNTEISHSSEAIFKESRATGLAYWPDLGETQRAASSSLTKPVRTCLVTPGSLAAASLLPSRPSQALQASAPRCVRSSFGTEQLDR